MDRERRRVLRDVLESREVDGMTMLRTVDEIVEETKERNKHTPNDVIPIFDSHLPLYLYGVRRGVNVRSREVALELEKISADRLKIISCNRDEWFEEKLLELIQDLKRGLIF